MSALVLAAAQVQVVLVALLVSVVAPTILALITNRSRRADKAQDWARIDAVAAQAKADAVVAREGQEKAAQLLAENNKIVAETARDTTERLTVIHTLVNSNMTAAMQENLDATVRERVALKAQEAMLISFQHMVPPELSAAIALAEAKISELTIQLNDRKRQQGIVEAQEKTIARG